MKHFIAFLHFIPESRPDAAAIKMKFKSISPIPANPIWFQKDGAAFGVTTDKHAIDIENSLRGIRGLDRTMIVEVAGDWYADRDTIEAGWLKANLGQPGLLR